eukprot:12892290-Prorocentrum_lima.AAC.1
MEVMENRQRFIDFLTGTQLRALNTYFTKPPRQLITFKEAGTQYQDPLIRGNYETLDFVLSPQRWRNAITD